MIVLAVKVLRSGKEVDLILNGLCPQTAYELEHHIPPSHQFTIPTRSVKRKLEFSDDDEPVKKIKIE